MSKCIFLIRSFRIEWDSRHRKRRDLQKKRQMARVQQNGSNSAFWPLLDAIGMYSWSSGCLPIITDFDDSGHFGQDFDDLNDFGQDVGDFVDSERICLILGMILK